MYKIIGIDGQQYGPVTADQIRNWLRENRVRGDTLVQSEGATDWRPLSSFPEFSGNIPPLAALPPVYHAGSGSNPRASSKIAAGVCGILLGGLGIHKFILGYTGAGLILLLTTLLTCGLASPITHIIGLIEGILYLTKSDDEFVRTYVDGRKEWF